MTGFEDGLQRERTALSWNRTAMALLVAGALFTRHIGPPYLDLAHVPGYAALAAGAIVLWLAAHDSRWRTKTGHGSAQLRPRRAWSIGVMTLVLNASSLLIVVVGR